VDGDQQAADPVGWPGGLGGQVVVEAAQDLQFSQGFVAGVDPAEGVRQSPGGIGDDEGVTKSVLAFPGWTSARRRMVRPGR
jgi:hypothetical protein